MGGDIAAVIGGVAAAIAVIVTAFRRRKDTDYSEMQKRITDLTGRVEGAEEKIKVLRREFINCENRNFQLQRLLAANGIVVPEEI